MTGTVTWTDERFEILKKLWSEGLAASEIASRLGGFEHCADGGRNAVLSKIHRSGLSDRIRIKDAKRQTYRTPRKYKEQSVGAPTPSGIAADSKPVTLPELTETTCRWPLGDFDEPTTHFCGANSKRGQPYCDFHMRVAYPPRAKKPEPDPNRPYQPATPTQEAING